jgi:carboxyl-terminal processing protease
MYTPARVSHRRAVPRGLLLAVLIPLVLVAGIWLGGHPSSLPGPVRDVFVDDSEGRLYDEALNVIYRDYYRPVDRDAILNTSIEAAVKSLNDRFSNYFDPKSFKSFQEATNGAFEGVGMNVEQADEGLRVLTVFDGSPAKKSGIKAGDLITKVNGRSIQGKSSNAATALIKGPAGSSVTLTVKSGDRSRDVKLQRAKVTVPVVSSEMRELDGRKIGHVTLAGFTDGAGEQVRDATKRLLDQGAKGIVLDLRDNGGGLLNEAVSTASVFVKDGTVVSTDGRARPKHVFKATGGAIDGKIPVVVLVNRESASASEIVTGALQDRHRAEVVGTRTFGKGVFQEIEPLRNGGALDITVGEYFLPSGRNIGGGGVKQGAGIKPDVDAQDDPKTKRDEALDVAVRTVARESA